MDDEHKELQHRYQIDNWIKISVNIQWNETNRNYSWTYDGPPCVDKETGNFKLPDHGKTAIVYTLDSASSKLYQLIYVNMDPTVCATWEIEEVRTSKDLNSITLIDRNSYNHTKYTPFSLRLAARMTNNIESGFLSPDPQVTNNPDFQRVR